MIEGSASGIATVSDLSGRTIFIQKIANEIERVDASSWAKGMYLITIQNGNGRMVKKVIKK